MRVVGLTGGIGMGKTTVAAMFADFGVPVCDADALVHRMLSKGGEAVEEVARLFPEALENGAINRAALGGIVFADEAKRKALENIVHPKVGREEIAFAGRAEQEGKSLVVLEIPLLFEAGAHRRCDKVVVASCAPEIQRERALFRPGMSEEKLRLILAAQWPDEKRRAHADYVIDTGLDLAQVRQQVQTIMEMLSA
jgi:dephospho-CoA kinase